MRLGRQDTFLIFFAFLSCPCFAQSLKPGLEGMAPSKWITIRNTHAPGKTFSFPGVGNKTFTQEEFYFRAWLPVLRSKRITTILGPNFRTEKLEFKNSGENPISSMNAWNLRTFGLDLNSFVRLDSTSWLIVTSHINKSGNFAELSNSQIPFNYTVSAEFLKKKSANKEIGAGLMVNKSYKLTVLPVFIFNYNYAPNAGIEIMLPKKISWRNNLSPSDILYVKAESVTRTYYINGITNKVPGVCRRVDIDMGVAYNRKLGSYAGVELFAGYRKNLTSKLIDGAIPVKTSGFAATLELYVQPPHFKKKK